MLVGQTAFWSMAVKHTLEADTSKPWSVQNKAKTDPRGQRIIVKLWLMYVYLNGEYRSKNDTTRECLGQHEQIGLKLHMYLYTE